MKSLSRAVRRRVGPLVLVLATMLPVEGAPQDRVNEVEQVIADFLVPFSNRDVAHFVEFFADDATVFFPSTARGAPSGRVQGKAAIAREFEALYRRSGVPSDAPPLAIRPADLTVQRFADVSVVTFHLGTDTARGRRTFVLRRTDAGWRIMHLHASDFRTQ